LGRDGGCVLNSAGGK